MEIFILILIGIAGGLIAGMMGVGGGIIFTPVLYFLFEHAEVANPVQWSVASGLFCTFVAASSSTVRQATNKHLFVKEGLLLGAFGAAGITLGKLVLTSGYYNHREFAVFFSLILFYSAYMMFRRGADKTSEYKRKFGELSPKAAFVSGGIGGFVASLAGVGGGGVMVPIMNIFFKQPFPKAVSISHLGMTLMITVGLIQLLLQPVDTAGISSYTFGYVDVGAALPLSGGGLIGALVGTNLSRKINRSYLQWGFALLATIMGGRLLLSVF